MSEARRRGTFEQRKKFAKDAARRRRIEADAARREAEAAMTPEERQRRANAQVRLAIMAAMASSWRRIK